MNSDQLYPKWVDVGFLRTLSYSDLSNKLKKTKIAIIESEKLIWQLETDRYDDDLDVTPGERLAQAKAGKELATDYFNVLERELSERFGLMTEKQYRDSYKRATSYYKPESVPGLREFDNSIVNTVMNVDITSPVIFEMLLDLPMMFVSCETFNYKFQLLSNYKKNHCYDEENNFRSLCGVAKITQLQFAHDVPENHEDNCKLCLHILRKRRGIGYDKFNSKKDL